MTKLYRVFLGMLILCLTASLSFAADLAPFPKFTAIDSNGDPLSGGKLYAYINGTTTAKDTYTTSSGTVANTNPVILNTSGQADVWLDGCYKFILKDSSDVLQWTVDDVCGGTVGEVLSSTSGYIAIYSGVTTVSGVSAISGASLINASVTSDKISGVSNSALPDPITTPEIRTEANMTGKIYIINLTGNPVALAGGKTGTTISGASVYGGWTKSGTQAQIGNNTTEVTAIMTSAVKGMSHVFRILQNTALSGGTVNVLFEAGDNIASQTAIIAGVSKYILSGTTNAKKLVLTASGTSVWEVDEVGSPTVNWD